MWFGIEFSSLWLPELVHFNHLQDELDHHLSGTKCVAFSFLCVSWCHRLWEEDSIISSVFLDLCVVLPVFIYSGNRMKNLFWLFSSGFQPINLQVSHLFLEEEIWIECMYCTPAGIGFPLPDHQRYGTVRYCGQRGGLSVERPLRNSKYFKKMFQ